MEKKTGAISLLCGCAFFGVICYGALAVSHYDLDPISVLAALLNLSIETLGYISGALSGICLVSGLWLLFTENP